MSRKETLCVWAAAQFQSDVEPETETRTRFEERHLTLLLFILISPPPPAGDKLLQRRVIEAKI